MSIYILHARRTNDPEYLEQFIAESPSISEIKKAECFARLQGYTVCRISQCNDAAFPEFMQVCI